MFTLHAEEQEAQVKRHFDSKIDNTVSFSVGELLTTDSLTLHAYI